MWFILRIIVVVGVAWELTSFPTKNSNVGWIACAIVPSVTGIGLFLWLMASARYRNAVDWSKPFSVSEPFFPMNRNPVRFWSLAAISFLFGGVTALLKEILSGRHHAAFGATFIFMGIAIFLALAATRKFGPD